jgi:hypothetical protein
MKQRAKKVEAVVLNANMIAAVGGTIYKDPQNESTSTNLARDQRLTKVLVFT